MERLTAKAYSIFYGFFLPVRFVVGIVLHYITGSISAPALSISTPYHALNTELKEKLEAATGRYGITMGRGFLYATPAPVYRNLAWYTLLSYLSSVV